MPVFARRTDASVFFTRPSTGGRMGSSNPTPVAMHPG